MSIDASGIADLFHKNFAERGEVGASVCIWRGGEEIMSLAHGHRDAHSAEPWEPSTLALFWSATKGPAAACVLHTLQAHRIGLNERVAGIWPEFAQAGKEAITIGQLLSHQAGLAALTVDQPSILDYPAVIAALEKQPPLWPPGTGHGYHAKTFGFLLDELVRRLNGGMTLGDYWRKNFADPLDLEFWIGLPAAQCERVARMHPARTAPNPGHAFYAALGHAGSLTHAAFNTPKGLPGVSSMNTREAREASLPSLGGIGTARALAKFYAMLASDGELDGRRFFEESTLQAMTTTMITGEDKVLRMETAFSAGFMKDPIGPHHHKRRALFGPSLFAFGHPGAGGSLAFADPENAIAFAYVMNQMEPGVLSGRKALSLVDAIYG